MIARTLKRILNTEISKKILKHRNEVHRLNEEILQLEFDKQNAANKPVYRLTKDSREQAN